MIPPPFLKKLSGSSTYPSIFTPFHFVYCPQCYCLINIVNYSPSLTPYFPQLLIIQFRFPSSKFRKLSKFSRNLHLTSSLPAIGSPFLPLWNLTLFISPSKYFIFFDEVFWNAPLLLFYFSLLPQYCYFHNVNGCPNRLTPHVSLSHTLDYLR